MDRLLRHDWPGNVRELENTIERAVIMARGGIIAEEHITFPGQEARRPIDVTQSLADGTTLEAFLKDMESRYLRRPSAKRGTIAPSRPISSGSTCRNCSGGSIVPPLNEADGLLRTISMSR